MRVPTPTPHVRQPSSALAPTGTLVAEMWDSTGLIEPISGWVPKEVEEELESKQRRWGMILVTGLAVISVAVAGYLTLAWQDAAAAAAANDVATDARALTTALENGTTLTRALSEGAIGDVYQATLLLGTIDAIARELFDTAGRLPTGDGGFGDLRRRAADVASQALETESLLSDTVGYGTTLSTFLDRPDLPDRASEEALPGLAANLAGWVVEFTDGAAALPTQGAFEGHRTRVTTLAESLERWQTAYLDALRTVDVPAAAARLAELDGQLDVLHQEWLQLAAAVSETSDTRIEGLTADLEELTRSD